MNEITFTESELIKAITEELKEKDQPFYYSVLGVINSALSKIRHTKEQTQENDFFINNYGFSVRCLNAIRGYIDSADGQKRFNNKPFSLIKLSDLCTMSTSELLCIRNMGKKSLNELFDMKKKFLNINHVS